MNRLRDLSEDTLRRLAEALAAGRVAPPWAADALTHAVGGPTWLPAALQEASNQGVPPSALAVFLGLLAEERAHARRRWEGVELTWTGPDDVATETRDTGAVARQLFATATHSLLVATYAIDGGTKGAALLAILRDRMQDHPDLRVRLFLNVHRDLYDDRPEGVVVSQFATGFWRDVWPWDPHPEVFFDRRSVEPGSGPRACLHAKVVVQDDVRTLVTSANLTEAAQLRNVEAGILLHDAAFARQVQSQFDRLIARGVLLPLPRLP